MRFGDTRRLAPALIRAMPREQLAIGFAVAFALIWLLPGQSGGPDRIFALQAAALALSLALATILDEPAAETANATPPTLLARRVLTLALALPATAVAWSVLAWIGDVGPARTANATLQLAAFVFVTLALAAAIPHRADIAGPAVALTFIGAYAAKPEWIVAPDPGNTHWMAAWAALTAGGALALLMASRDPARSRRHIRSRARQRQTT